ncbi:MULTISPECIES: RagB/SusD family nutrient uptake outer membrane protein [unclassified Proteiniphilum]|jgi:hypothetical protein|uniref:RagB/SusD family nutrient uptake outer membrane protein n=1 Tax=unclassified Proteiniphilum TaxID=2622718 RepID=UPI002580C91B|nr:MULTISPECIES: RagB/SusD family nutrient uptake outer membrane protein [unclassified Proteiniphilum]
MKKKNILVLFSLFIFMASCHDRLDIIQDNRLSASNMWQDEEDLKSATYGAYYYLRNTMKTNVIYWGEYRNGLWGPGTHGTLLNNNQADVVSATMSATNPYASWTNLYTTINLVNLIIKYGQNMEINEEARNFALSNAYFIRAYTYFWIGRIWGDAPLALEGFESTSQDLYLHRSPQADVFNQVESDLVAAEQFLTGTGDKTILTPAALAMLKADFGLWMYRIQNGGDKYLTYAESAISSLSLNPSRLENEFSAIFSPSNKRGKEIIFVIPNEYGESEGGFPSQHTWNRGYIDPAYANTEVPIGENQWWLYTDDYINIITSDPTDIRIPVTYGHGPYGTGGLEVRWANKFVGQMISGTRVLDSDIVIYRYAQAYLFDAEIKYYRKNYTGALNSLGVITNRAYSNINYYNDETDSAVLEAIVTENIKEFASEANTWWTLIRTDKVWDYNKSLASQKSKKNILLWPITQSALNRNYNLAQTEGWQGQ